VELYEVGTVVPVVNVGGATVTEKPAIHFSSEGPHIAGLGDDVALISDRLNKNDGGAYLHKMMLKITDADSPLDSLDISVGSDDKRLTGKVEAADGDDMYMLTLTITEDAALAATIVTVKVVDNHDKDATSSFTVTMVPFSCKDRLKHVRWVRCLGFFVADFVVLEDALRIPLLLLV
jgi:hypothetical protein